MINLKLETTTGAYVGAKAVYIAQLKRSLLKPQLLKFGQADIEVEDRSDESARDKAVVQALKKLLREKNVSSKNVITALPGKEVLIRYFQIPKIPRTEWETAIKFEAKKFIPFKIEELMWDFNVDVPRVKDAKMDVTFVAVKKETSQKYLSLLKQAGLKPTALEPAPFSLVRLFTSSNQLVKDKPTAIVDVDYGMADINMVKNKICYLTRDVFLPLEEEVLFDNLFNEIRMSLEYYEKLFPTEAVDKILLCGEVELRDWDKRLAEELKVKVERIDFTRAIKMQKAFPSLNMGVVVGLILRGLTKPAAEVNLLQEHEVKTTKAVLTKEALAFTPEIKQAVIRAVVFSVVLLALLHLAMYRQISQERKKLNAMVSLRPKIRLPIDSFTYSKLEEESKKLNERLSSLKKIIDKRIFWTNKFNELPRMIPPGVWLTELSFQDTLAKGNIFTRNLTITGIAYDENPVEEIGIITKFVAKLKENAHFFDGFEEIKLDSMTAVGLAGMQMKKFAISCEKK